MWKGLCRVLPRRTRARPSAHSSAAPELIATTFRRPVDHLIQRSEFLTSYTPYQPEISQGTLQTLFEFQTQVAAITGMQIANASMYDGSTGAAEAVLMAHRITGRDRAILSGNLHPHYADTIRTMSGLAGEIVGNSARTRARKGISSPRSMAIHHVWLCKIRMCLDTCAISHRWPKQPIRKARY